MTLIFMVVQNIPSITKMAVDDISWVSISSQVTTDPLRLAVTGEIVNLDFNGWTFGPDTLEKVNMVELTVSGGRVAVLPDDETSLEYEVLLNSSQLRKIPVTVQVSSS